MRPDEHQLWRIAERAKAGNVVTETDLSFAETFLTSIDAQDVANACEIIFRCAVASDMRQRALNALERLCLAPTGGSPKTTVLNAMLFLLEGELAGNGIIREFVFNAARDGVLGVRVNSVFILGRIACLDDVEALKLLKSMTNDEHEFVRNNAQLWMKNFPSPPTQDGDRQQSTVG